MTSAHPMTDALSDKIAAQDIKIDDSPLEKANRKYLKTISAFPLVEAQMVVHCVIF